MYKQRFTLVIALAMSVVLLFAASAQAALTDTTNFSQTISAGALDTEIRDASRVAVASPSVSFPSISPPFTCQTQNATLGTDSERIYVDNGDSADSGWTLTMAPTGGATATWNDGTADYDFNDADTSGCGDGGDTDSVAGQMTVDPSVSTLTTDCDTCTSTGITKGSSTAYDEGVTDSVTLLTADNTSDDVGRWYLTGVDVDQTVPAGQTSGTYTLDMTITVTAS